MEFGFLFWIFFIGLVVASLQDLKRREVDNWLNLLLVLMGSSYIFFSSIFEGNYDSIFVLGFSLVVLYIFSNVFYYGRVFAGGDAKLLFSMTPFFVAVGFFETFLNVGVFVLYLMGVGSVYGLCFSFVLYLRDFKKINERIKKDASNIYYKCFITLGVLFFVFGFFSFSWLFFVLGIFFVGFPSLLIFSRGLEEVSMTRFVSGRELREGDWLAKSVRVGKRVIEASWEGITKEEIKILKKKRKIEIKEGIPFVPSFLIAFLAYVFLREWFLGVVFGVF